MNNSEKMLNELFNRQYIYVISYSDTKKYREFYTEKIKLENKIEFVLGLLYLEEDKAKKYELELKQNNLDIFVEKLKIEKLIDYCDDLKLLQADGFVINYPYNWATYMFKQK